MIEAGYRIVEFNEKADIYVINTCTVTNMADKKSRQMLHRVKEKNPNSILVVTGCYAQVTKDELEKVNEIDLILGVNEKNDIARYVEKLLKSREYSENINNDIYKRVNKSIDKNINENVTQNLDDKNIVNAKLNKPNNKREVVQVSKIEEQKEFLDFGTVTYTEKTRAVIKVQDGCNQFCSYCIIPYARGRVRSRKPESILKEIEEITKQGIKEVVITGIHVASYGKDFTEEDVKENEYRLIDLLEDIQKIEGVKRIRLGSLEPTLITEEFVERLSKLSKICDQFHLSLQSGCNETLKRMNRKYTTEEFEKGVELLRNAFKQVHLTTDIIVGFPGETEEEFNKTYEFLKKIKFYKMHVFKYSPRKGTVAAKMPNQIDGNKKEERSNKLIELSDKNEADYQKQYIGKEVEVLFEEKEEEYLKGHTTNYMVVRLEENLEDNMLNKDIKNKNSKKGTKKEDLKNIPNSIQTVKILKQENMELVGELKL